jgi:hypothetical protein
MAYCNPNRCARKAFEVYLNGKGFTCRNGVDGDPAFGPFEDITDTGDNAVEAVRGPCGKPKRVPPGRQRGA